MRDSMHAHPISLVAIFVCVAVLAFWQASSAGVLDRALVEWDPDSIQGRIMEIGPDYLIIQERKVILVDEVHAGKHHRTEILDLNGNTRLMSELKVGKVVYVKGGLAPDGETENNILVATQIYLLRNTIDRKRIMNHETLFTPATPW
ncbi:MAG: hypothetical protein ACP5G0_03115 [Desulfomonilia bacterium]